MVQKLALSEHMQKILHIIRNDAKPTKWKVKGVSLWMLPLTKCSVDSMINYVVVYFDKRLKTSCNYNIPKQL
jgi:hypothetical protein